MTDLAKYVVALEAQTAKYQRELDRANRKLSRFHRDTTRRLDAIGNSFRRLGGFVRSGLGFFVGAGAAALIRQSLAQADALDKLGTRLGVSARELQAWQIIAEQFNLSQREFNLGIQRAIRRVAEAAQGMGEAREALRTLGIDARRFNQLSLDQRMLTLANAFGEVGDEAEQLRLAFKLFDSEGTAMLQILKQGETALQALRKETEGQLWSEEQIDRLARLNTELTKLEQKFKLTFGPTLIALGQSFFNMIEEIQNRLKLYVRNVQAAAGNAVAAQKILKDAGLLGPADGDIVIDRGARVDKEPDFSPRNVRPGSDFAIKKAVEGIFAPSSEIKDASEVMTTRIDAMVEEFSELIDKQREAKDLFVTLFTDNMVQAAESGFKSILRSWVRTLQQMAARFLASKLFDFLNLGSSSGGFLGLGKLISGKRGHGGFVSANKAFLVGERGPEIFAPPAAGRIIAGAGGATFNIDARGADIGVEQRIRTAMEDVLARAEFNRLEAAKRSRP